ncbi:hypothetical protein [Ruegeria arenilitoris]|uniref:hypothetical protein n=1 Tax=Ruegeria arenilitoris TaxID=1173585 RepID=UPI00147AA915|nr:hypothetical protein [Ruegeria arenilitoris]
MRLIKLLKRKSMTSAAVEVDFQESTLRRTQTSKSEITRLFRSELKAGQRSGVQTCTDTARDEEDSRKTDKAL